MKKKDKKTTQNLWGHNPKRFCGKITQEQIKATESFIINNQKVILDPAYMIKKWRKPTLKERIKDPGVRRIIEDCEILEVSIVPVSEKIEDISYKKENILIKFCYHFVTIIHRIRQKVKNPI